MGIERWLPAIVRRHPDRTLSCRYRIVPSQAPIGSEATLAEALRSAGVSQWERSGPCRWELTLYWRTMVLGVIGRDGEECVRLHIVDCGDATELQLSCVPLHTHGAHAAGMAGVLLMAVVVWLVGGWTSGVAPGLTTAAAGGLWADWSREMALTVLGRRLRRLVEDLGSALWPGLPAEVLPHPRRV